MAEFIYTTVPGKIKALLEKIRTVGIPKKATNSWLKSIGFTSSNDSSLIGVLKFVGITDSSGIPSTIWSQYRGAHHRTVLGGAIQSGYSEVFAVYSDAWQRPNTDLEHVFSTSSTAGKQAIQKTVATFKALCEVADFDPAEKEGVSTIPSGPLPPPQAPSPTTPHPSSTHGTSPSVHIDIQIHISPEASGDQIDRIFKSMAKHLYGSKDGA